MILICFNCFSIKMTDARIEYDKENNYYET